MDGMFRAEQLRARVNQKRAKQVQDPRKTLDQDYARANHGAAQNQRAQYAPKEHPVLVSGVDMEIREDQQKNEDVVYAEGFFNQVAGEKFEAGSAPVREENPDSKSYRQRHPCRAFERRLANRNRMGAPVEQPQIEQQDHRHANIERDPKSPGAHLRAAPWEKEGHFRAGDALWIRMRHGVVGFRKAAPARK